MDKFYHKNSVGADLHEPKEHKTSHHDGESDPIDHDLLLNFLANKHINWTGATEDFYTAGKGQFMGNLGVGSPPNDAFIIRATKDISLSGVSGVYGRVRNVYPGTTGSTGGLYYVGEVRPGTLPGNAVVANLYGCSVRARLENADYLYTLIATNMWGYKSEMVVAKTAIRATNVVSAKHFWAVNPSVTGGATMTTLYAFYDAGMTRGTADNWGYYGLTAKNYLSGTLQAGGYISQDGSSGVSGSFTTADVPAKTITVKNGIITSIV